MQHRKSDGSNSESEFAHGDDASKTPSIGAFPMYPVHGSHIKSFPNHETPEESQSCRRQYQHMRGEDFLLGQ